VVGVNRFHMGDEIHPELQRIDEQVRNEQIERTEKVKASRDQAAVDRSLGELRTAAQGDGNLMVPMHDALKARATLQEVCDVLRDIWGGYVPRDTM
jgi:methylmalonyl-CoA mutase N-terminal domain/subunit